MKSLFKIYRRYILSAGWIAAVVILVNMCVMMVVGTYFASQNRDLCRHSLSWGKLGFSSVRHEYASCSDSSVKTLYQSLLGTNI